MNPDTTMAGISRPKLGTNHLAKEEHSKGPSDSEWSQEEAEDEDPKGLEEVEAYNDSSGYESNLTSLDDEENDDDISRKTGVLCLTTGSCEELVPVCESTQLVLDSSLCNKEQLEEEQQEVSWEES